MWRTWWLTGARAEILKGRNLNPSAKSLLSNTLPGRAGQRRTFQQAKWKLLLRWRTSTIWFSVERALSRRSGGQRWGGRTCAAKLSLSNANLGEGGENGRGGNRWGGNNARTFGKKQLSATSSSDLRLKSPFVETRLKRHHSLSH